MQSELISPIKLNLSEKLKDRDYFHRFFRGRAQDEIAGQIKELREKRGLKQRELAKRCKTHQSAISRLEQATYSRWNLNTLWSLAKALDARVRIIIEPMEDVIREYEEMEREVPVSGVIAVFWGQLPGLERKESGALGEAWITPRTGISPIPQTHAIEAEA